MTSLTSPSQVESETVWGTDVLPESTAESTSEPLPGLPQVPPFPVPWRHPLRCVGWILRMTFGVGTLIGLLAIVAAVPVLNLLVLGYFLEAEGRVVRSGRFRDGFPLLGFAPRLGSIAIGFLLFLGPLLFINSVATDARLIDPDGIVANRWTVVLNIASVTVGVHLALALARGGTFGCFVRPLKNLTWLIGRLREHGVRNAWLKADETLANGLRATQPGQMFWLGLRGLIGGLIWLVPPTVVFAAADSHKPATLLITVLGGMLLMLVFGWLPMLQARFAATNEFRTLFRWKETRRLFGNAPLAWMFAIVITYVLALPLYLAKVALPPRDAVWLLTPLFIVGVYPARILTGWAVARAERRETPAWFGWRWLGRLVIGPLLAAYVFLLFFTQYVGAEGRQVLFQHHALLLPSPF
ncbi:DUF4013 domain-containing protein [Thalassoroseus pseudoceratinae]|uniref:DUF4013 domain-containing protein n=1 Tax=Thalassoroseus pseudoceratinae TaxID=2713176 RepID=UPI00141DB5BD|nr:DUF4013 domain-containing protein [Thalassoroseus pseudoceratinae]